MTDQNTGRWVNHLCSCASISILVGSNLCSWC